MVRSGIALLSALTLTAIFVCRALIEAEAERVLTVHVADKAGHLIDMIEANVDRPEGLRASVQSPEIVEMANASYVAAIYLFDRNGIEVDTSDTNDGNKPELQKPLDKPSVAVQSNALRGYVGHQHYELPLQESRNQRQTTKHSHHHAHSDAEITSLLADADRPNVADFNSVFTGREALFASFHTIHLNDHERYFAQVVVPAHDPTGDVIGFVGLTLDVSHFYSAIGDGFWQFATFLIALGVVLFGVPAIGFWTQKREAERSTRDVGYLSSHDTLTGLLNRQAFVSQTQEQMRADTIGYVGYVDIDRFKLINDTYGHSAGDAFLKQIALVLWRRFGEKAIVARFGGDEFTFALPRKYGVRLNLLIESVRQEAEAEMQIDGFTIASSISMGIASLQTGQSLETGLLQADQALYFAKSQGRNRAAHYTDAMGEAASRRRNLEAWLKHACREKLFEVAFQPLIDARSEETTGYEALLRLKDAEGVPISPAEFIPLAESIGLIEDIGEWVLFEAIAQISALDDTSSVSVNLSAEQFKSERIVGLVKNALKTSNLCPKRLELEITESLLLEHEERTQAQIDALKAIGVKIAMDDFGTGFSSLSTLWRYGFDRIKIDRSFVQALEVSPERSTQLIDTMVLLAARMGMSITAEGIETEEQKKILTKLGCDVLQGFYFGKPKPISYYDVGPFVGKEPKQETLH